MLTSPLGQAGDLGQIAALTLFVAFGAAAAAKAAGFGAFRDSLAGWGLSTRRARTPLAASVIALEAAGAIMLALGAVTTGAVVLGTLLVVFTGAALVARRRNPSLSCACFSTAQPEPVGAWHFMRNAVMTTLAVVAAVTFSRWSLDLAHAVAGGALAIALLLLERAVPVLTRPAPIEAGAPAASEPGSIL